MFDYTAAMQRETEIMRQHMREHGCSHIEIDQITGEATCSLGASVHLPVYFNGREVARNDPSLPPAVRAHLAT